MRGAGCDAARGSDEKRGVEAVAISSAHASIIREKCPPKNDVKPLAIRATRGNSGQILAKFLRDGTVQRVGFQWIADSAPFGTKSLQFSESATCPHRAPGTRDQGRSKRDRGPSTRQKKCYLSVCSIPTARTRNLRAVVGERLGSMHADVRIATVELGGRGWRHTQTITCLICFFFVSVVLPPHSTARPLERAVA